MSQDADDKQLAEALDQHHQEIARRWLARIQADLKDKQIAPTELRDGIPDYLAYLADELRAGDGGESEGRRAWLRVARDHGITRVRLGFDIRQLVHEFAVLGRVIRAVLKEHAAVHDGSQWERVDELLQAAVGESLKSYVEHRDYQMRRREAEHVGFITHELRNPLTTAMVASSKLRQLVGDSAEGKRALEMLDRNHARIRALIDSVLNLERRQLESVQARPKRVTLGELLDSALSGTTLCAEEKGVRIEIDAPGELALSVDPELTISILSNLIENAVKYTDFGAVSVTVEERGEEIVVHVRDNCEGISDEELAVIFEPFKRGRTGTSGFGLGLSIARRAAEAQGGSLHAESPGERGCHFWLVLPRQVRAQPAEPAEASHGARNVDE